MKKVIQIDTGETVVFRHVKKSDIDGIWRNFNEVLEEGTYLPVFTPVKTEIEKNDVICDPSKLQILDDFCKNHKWPSNLVYLFREFLSKNTGIT